MSRAVVFDLDGTLVDSVADLAEALCRLLDELDRRRLGEDEVRRMVGDGARVLVRRALAETGPVPVDLDAPLRRFLALYEPLATERTRPYDGVPEVLTALKRAAFTLAVCTNKPIAPTRRILDATGLSAHFTAVVGGDELPFRKPDPRHVLAALGRLGTSVAVMVGDSDNDVSAGRGAGCKTIAVTWGYGARASLIGADCVVEHPDALVARIEELSR